MRVRTERHFVAWHGGAMWDSQEAAEIAPWAAAAGEPVLMRVAVEPAGKGEGIRAATTCRIPPDEDAAEYVTKVADALAERLTLQIERRRSAGLLGGGAVGREEASP